MNFEFHSVPRIVFGRGQLARAGELAASFGRKALVITNADLPGQSRLIGRLTGLLDRSGVTSVVLPQAGEPQVRDLDTALAAAQDEACTLAIGFGGGSAIDAAKAAAGLIANGGTAADYMEIVGKGLKLSQPAIPWIAIPTTAGTGAEVTRNAVIGWKEKQFKASIRSEHLLARVALVDPELGLDVPPEVTARCGMDALCQLIKSYTSTGATPLSDALALEGVALAARALPAAYADPANLAAREAMAAAAMMSGITLTNAGLGAVHGLAAPLGANLEVPHGTACASLLGPILRVNLAELRRMPPGESRARSSLARYAAVGRALAGRPDLDDAEAADEAAEICLALTRELNIPGLGRFGLTAALAEHIATLAQKSSSMRYNPVPLSAATLTEALLAAM